MSHTKSLSASFSLRRLGMTGALGTVIAAPAATGQCPTPLCPSGCTTVCEVTTQAELVAALCCHTATGTCCSHIRIPSGTTLVVTSEIRIEDEHDGLHLEIQGPTGKVQWEGPTGEHTLFNLSACTGILIDGGGTITSIFEPVEEEDHEVVTAFRIRNGAANVTIKNLSVSKVTDVVKVEAGGATDLTLTNIHGRNLGDYGIWINERIVADIENCSMTQLLDEHPFRLYGQGLAVLNCSSHGSPKTGIWTAEGDDFTVDRFSSDKWLRFGPDNGYCNDPPVPCASDPLTNLFARELHTTDYTRIEMGLQGGCLVNLHGSMTVGRQVGDVAPHNMELNTFNWDAVSGTVTIITSNPGVDWPDTVHEIEYNYCFADVVRNNEVDIDDLLAVISAWGDCPAPPTGFTSPPPPCAGDIYPEIVGDDEVNIDDLLMVISNWGGCAAHPMCGNLAAQGAGQAEDAPETIDDCWDLATAKYPEGGDRWAAAFEACVEAIEETGNGG